jgi:hypothetical protein
MSRRTKVVRRSGRRFSLDGAEELPMHSGNDAVLKTI